MENHNFSWENSLFLWWISIVMLVITRGYLIFIFAMYVTFPFQDGETVWKPRFLLLIPLFSAGFCWSTPNFFVAFFSAPVTFAAICPVWWSSTSEVPDFWDRTTRSSILSHPWRWLWFLRKGLSSDDKESLCENMNNIFSSKRLIIWS